MPCQINWKNDVNQFSIPQCLLSGTTWIGTYYIHSNGLKIDDQMELYDNTYIQAQC